jgi:hypothetical protein
MRKVKVLAKVFGVAVLFVIVALPVGGLLSQVNASDSFKYQTLSEYKGTYSKGEWATISNASDKSAKSDGPQWSILHTPGSIAGKKEILSPSEVNKIAVAAGGTTIWAVDTPAKAVRKSSFNGWSWSDTPNAVLHNSMTAAGIPEDNQFIWDIAVAPDDANFLAVVTGSATSPDPTEVWVSDTGGTHWARTNLTAISGGAIIGAVDISPGYSNGRDIAVGARDGVPGAFSIWVVKSIGFEGWKLQTVVPAANADILALKFSPSYFVETTGGDSALAVVYSTDSATYFDIALRDRDPASNDIVSWVYGNSIEVKSPGSMPGASPEAATIVTADLELPGDFNGQDSNLRRTYISTDDAGAGSDTGIFLIDDDSVVCHLMNTTGTEKRISSISYYGTYDAGRLLAGEVLGYPCLAQVPTWFTDIPTECPIPCWYPALKPPTGAAAQGTCALGTYGGYGNAQVAWSPDSPDGRIAYCGTSSADFSNGGVNTTPGSGCWPAALLTSVALDESAFSLSSIWGETWNQVGLIDTRIDKLTDVAPSADSSTIYLASINDADIAGGGCTGFDSVWRSSTNANIVAPLPAQSIGTVWERVQCRPTSLDCTQEQTNHALLRLAPDKEGGEIVFWAAQGTRAQVWSPDYGNYWANVIARWPIQDFVPESSMVLYNLSPIGLIQKMPYTGTAWSTALPNVDTGLGSAYSITALAGGHVLVGGGISSMFPVAYSNNGAQSFTPIIQPLAVSNIIVAFDAHFTSNGIIYAATHRTSGGSIYCNTVPKYTKWTDLKPRGLGYYGIAIDDQGVLYVANPSFVEYMRGPIQPKSKKTNWDALTTGLPGSINLTLSPNSLKLSNEPKNRTHLYTIDKNSYNPITNTGMLWTWREIK